MDRTVFEQWRAEGLLSDESYARLNLSRDQQLVSVHWEIKTILYLGVMLLSAGLGTLVYKNIDSIGHQVIILFITLVCSGCYYYCFKNKLPFSAGKVAAPNSFFDYILLLGCCTFITLIAYLQFQYTLFGDRYGLASFFPMVVLFFTAYYFDHLGILSMAIVNFAAWLGITVTPKRILISNDFNSNTLIFTGLALGVLLIVIAWTSVKKDFKKHFEFTYANFGTHILLISCLAAMFHFSATSLIWFVLLMGMVYFFYRKALSDKSFYFMLVITLYSFVGISYLAINFLVKTGGIGLGTSFLIFSYFIIAGIGLVLFLIATNKKLKS